jgi:hypothetical protein
MDAGSYYPGSYFYSGDSRIGPIVRNEVGQPISSFYGYKVRGIFADAAEVLSAPYQDGAEAGFLRFADLDTLTRLDHRTFTMGPYIGTGDMTRIGNPNPDFTSGINLELKWKGFDFSAFIYGLQGGEIYNYNRWFTDFWPSFQGQKSKDLLYNSWTPLNTDPRLPKASNKSNFSTNTNVNSLLVEDGSYWRLKSLQLGYFLPAKWVSNINVKSLRIYLQAVNLFTITGYSGLDPEIGGNDTCFGIDYGNYPVSRQFIFGLSLSL